MMMIMIMMMNWFAKKHILHGHPLIIVYLTFLFNIASCHSFVPDRIRISLLHPREWQIKEWNRNGSTASWDVLSIHGREPGCWASPFRSKVVVELPFWGRLGYWWETCSQKTRGRNWLVLPLGAKVDILTTFNILCIQGHCNIFIDPWVYVRYKACK